MNKIRIMLESNDIAMINLGACMALGKGKDWCMINLPFRNYVSDKMGGYIRNKVPVIETTHRHMFQKDNLMVVCTGMSIYCREDNFNADMLRDFYCRHNYGSYTNLNEK